VENDGSEPELELRRVSSAPGVESDEVALSLRGVGDGSDGS
jgi:hypothetical protein